MKNTSNARNINLFILIPLCWDNVSAEEKKDYANHFVLVNKYDGTDTYDILDIGADGNMRELVASFSKESVAIFCGVSLAESTGGKGIWLVARLPDGKDESVSISELEMHTISQDDLVANPELAEAGVEVGEEVHIDARENKTELPDLESEAAHEEVTLTQSNMDKSEEQVSGTGSEEITGTDKREDLQASETIEQLHKEETTDIGKAQVEATPEQELEKVVPEEGMKKGPDSEQTEGDVSATEEAK